MVRRKSYQFERNVKLSVISVLKWLLLAVLIGLACGLVGSLFHYGVLYGTTLRERNPWLLYLLPVFGLGIVAIYKIFKVEGFGTNDIIEAVHYGKGLQIALLPAIFISTILTHAGGGSAGREGAALQMGGTIGHFVGKIIALDEQDVRTATMAGMAAFFTALFGTPVAASVFSMGVITVGMIYHATLIPCLAASFVALGVTRFFGMSATSFAVEAPALDPLLLLKVAFLGVLCAFVSILFCETMHFVEKTVDKRLKNLWLRVVIGGLLIVALTLLVGSQRYNGTGMAVIREALEGKALPWDFIMKVIFTVITLSFGFRGGEVIPSFFIGSTFGCVVGGALGIPPAFAASVGLVSVFCGMANVPLASTFLAVELFGSAGLPYYAVACAFSYALSGYSGLYSSQVIASDKLKAYAIRVRTNTKRHHPLDHKEKTNQRNL